MPRLRTPLVAAVAALLFTLTACAGAEPTSPASPAAAPGAFPVTIPHAFGATTVTAPPQRVVAVGINDADFALALGVVPVGAREFQGWSDWPTRPWARAAQGGTPAPQPLNGTTVPVEQIAALRPDLILGVYSFLDKATYDRLSGIAPTIAQPTPDGTESATWQEQTRTTGKALGRNEQAEQVVAATEKRFADARAAHPSFAGKSLSMDFVVDGVPYRLGTDDLRAQVFAGLGFRVPATTETLSPEQQGRLDADVIAVMGRGRAEAMADPVFANVPAVRAGRVVFLGGYGTEFAGALGYNSPLSLPYVIDAVSPQLDAALRGQAQGT